jgi:hypothetical protein
MRTTEVWQIQATLEVTDQLIGRIRSIRASKEPLIEVVLTPIKAGPLKNLKF